MSYFHTGIRTIIGAEAFHCPVRDGKEWDQLAMVIKQSLLFVEWSTGYSTNRMGSVFGLVTSKQLK